MDPSFQEEQHNLAEIEAKIDVVASRYEQEAKKLAFEIKDFFCVDYEDRDQLKNLRHKEREALDAAETYRTYQLCPYFARLDLDTNNNTEMYFIGKESISDTVKNSTIIVLDWRTPIASCYYAVRQTKFKIDGIEYTLALKRAIEIKNGKIIDIHTEYDGIAVALEGEIVDPFLLTVLKDKRRHNRLTDIIKTIQGNQNEIIRKPLMESFIVQGCAGSGKTMILLHRLSFLLFNNPTLSPNSIKIITPNKFFDAHINALSEELGLSKIQRFSVEEYYVYLIGKFSSKIPCNSTVTSEKALNTDLLRELYSIDYQNFCIRQYHAHWESVLDGLDIIRLKGILDAHEVDFPNISSHKDETLALLETSIKKILRKFDVLTAKKEALAERFTLAQSDLTSIEHQVSDSFNTLTSLANQTKLRINIELTKSKNSIDELTSALDSTRTKLTEHKKHSKALHDVEIQLQHIISSIENNYEKYLNYEIFITMDDAMSHAIAKNFSSLCTSIALIEDQLKATPVYNFGKKNSLKRQLSELVSKFSSDVKYLIDSTLEHANKQLLDTQNECSIVDDDIEFTMSSIHDIEKSLTHETSKLKAYQECNDLFAQSDIPEVKFALSGTASKECQPYLSAYEAQFSKYQKISQRQKALSINLHNLENERKLLMDEAANYPEGDLVFLQTDLQLLRKLQFNYITRHVLYKDMNSKYKSHGETYHSNNYRHRLYLKLLFSSLYYSSSATQDRFLNIDEAQDISIAEYVLLRRIVGSSCVLNLYGDINQSVYSYKGIFDWSDLKETLTDTIYVLNENYRNTLQITEFCNSEFEAGIYPIGINGSDVQFLSLPNAIQAILELKRIHSEYRVAIIYRYGIKAIQDELHKLLPGKDISWHNVDDHLISIISVETAKGLEFDAVISITDQMSNNEKYISYTRSLDNLIVVRDHFSTDIIEISDISENDPDFVENEEMIENEENIALQFQLILKLIGLLQKKINNTQTIHSSSSHPVTGDIQDDESNEQNISHSENSAEQLSTYPEVEFSDCESDPISNDIIAPNDVSISDENKPIIELLNGQLSDLFHAPFTLNHTQELIINDMLNNLNVAFQAPSGSFKNIILYVLALYMRHKNGLQTLLTAEAHLQENELVLAERIGLQCGTIEDSIATFCKDFKREKYDIIFIPYSFFKSQQNCKEFQEYFCNRVNYWGIDHPVLEKSLWPSLKAIGQHIHSNIYLMSKEIFSDLDLDDFSEYTISNSVTTSRNKTLNFTTYTDKLNWIKDNADLLTGQGLIYCNDESTCKVLSHALRKKKIKAEAYIQIADVSQKERINYLTNSFSSGGLPVLVTTQSAGKNLSNPHIRFIIHFDMPDDHSLYDLHTMQIGSLSSDPLIVDMNFITTS